MEPLQARTRYYGDYGDVNRLNTRYGRVSNYFTVHRKNILPGMQILEIGAAAGRYSHYFAQQGYEVDAVELVIP